MLPTRLFTPPHIACPLTLPPAHPHTTKPPAPGPADVVMLDTYSIHEQVNTQLFDSERVLELVPPDGHFALMNYR